MEFIPSEIENYALEHSGSEDPVLRDLRQETYAKMSMPQMLSGFLQGRLLYFLAKVAQTRRALEIGMFTGYASICIARALDNDGRLFCLELDDTCIAMAERYFSRANISEKIKILPGKALDNLSKIDGPLDFVFIDANKEDYIAYFEKVLPLVRKGGLIVADNVLWSGRVLESAARQDEMTQAIVAFNQKVSRDSRVETLLLPIRDGLMLLRKIS